MSDRSQMVLRSSVTMKGLQVHRFKMRETLIIRTERYLTDMRDEI